MSNKKNDKTKEKTVDSETYQNMTNYVLGKDAILLLILSAICYVSNMVYEYGYAFWFNYSYSLIYLDLNILLTNFIKFWAIFFLVIIISIKKIGKKRIFSDLLSVLFGLIGASIAASYLNYQILSIVHFGYFIFIVVTIQLFLYLANVLKRKNVMDLLYGLCMFVTFFSIVCFVFGAVSAKYQTNFESFNFNGKKYVLLKNYGGNFICKEYYDGKLQDGFVYISNSELGIVSFSNIIITP